MVDAPDLGLVRDAITRQHPGFTQGTKAAQFSCTIRARLQRRAALVPDGVNDPSWRSGVRGRARGRGRSRHRLCCDISSSMDRRGGEQRRLASTRVATFATSSVCLRFAFMINQGRQRAR
jgi:hypothetical protein